LVQEAAMKKLLVSLILAGFAGGAAAAASDGKWIHVRVDDAGGDKGRVDIQVPIEMVQSLLPVLKGAHARGSIQVDSKSVNLDEFREYWAAVRAAKDGEYVTVRDQDSNVRIAKRGGNFLLTVDDKAGKSQVRMKVPLPIIDAVLASGDSLDLGALSGALAKAPTGEILTVDDENSHVRVWIDGSAAPAREDTP
jgi:hypothetical protein